MELAIKEREIEVREGLDERNKSNKTRYTGELQKAHEMISQREGELDALERQNVQLTNEKQSIEQSLIKAEEQMQELQKEAAAQMANMQAESEQKIAGLKEEIEDGQNALRALKQELQSRDGELVTKTRTEDDLESAKAEYQAAKLANDEYRRVLRSKNSELAQVKRESDSLAKVQSLKVKELELVSSQDQKRLAAL